MKNASLKFKAHDLLTNSDVSKKRAIRVWIENEWKNMHIFGFFFEYKLRKGEKKNEHKNKGKNIYKNMQRIPLPKL